MFKIKSVYLYFLALKVNFYRFIRETYFKTSYYNNSLISIIPKKLFFFPNSFLLSSLTNYRNFSLRISNLNPRDLIDHYENRKDFDLFNNFLWLNIINRKNDASDLRKLISLWIDKNPKFTPLIWGSSITSLRIISWLLNADIILGSTNFDFKNKFLNSVMIQFNHLKKNYNYENNKVCQIEILSALIITGLVFKDYSHNFEFGIKELQKIIESYFDKNGFPISRSPNELLKITKYFIIVRECIKDAQSSVPEKLDEIIEKNLSCIKSITSPENNLVLFNGSVDTNLENFYNYLNHLNIKTKNLKGPVGGLINFKHKNEKVFFEVGSPPNKKYSKDYQSGPLSFEYFFDNEKIITNCGFGSGISKKAMIISKLTSAQSTLCINDTSVIKFERSKALNKAFGTSFKESFQTQGLEEINTDLEIGAKAFHDAYLKTFGFLHERKIVIDKKDKGLIGFDRIIRNNYKKKINFTIFFHLNPGLEAAKTISGQSILIKANKNKSLIFLSKGNFLDIENSIFLGKNKIINNLCIKISGELENEEKLIKWEIKNNI